MSLRSFSPASSRSAEATLREAEKHLREPATRRPPRTIRVLIDATSVRREKVGVGVYAKNLMDSLLADVTTRHAGADNTVLHYFLLIQDDDPEVERCDHPNVTMIRVPARIFRRLPLRILFEQFALPFLCAAKNIDVLHSIHYSFPLLLFGTRRVVTIHDMTWFLMPEVHEGIKLGYFRFFLRAARRLVDATIFVSASSQRDYKRLLGPLRHPSSIIPLGKSEAFQPGFAPSQTERARARYGIPRNFLLYIGTLEPRKNLVTLLRAFAALAPDYPELALVLAGNKGWKDEYSRLQTVIRELHLESRVKFTGFIQEQDKPCLISAATLFVYPSLYEGFGLPVLEAMACGVPTITSNLSSLPEVAGDAALLIDPTDTAALEAAMRRVLSDRQLSSELSQRAIRQAAQFTWKQTASATADVYLEASSRLAKTA